MPWLGDDLLPAHDDVAADRKRCGREGFAPGATRDSFYYMREFQLRDPDGHVVWFGQDLKP